MKDIPKDKPEICGLLRDKTCPYYLTLNQVEFAYGWPDTTGEEAVTSEWIHPRTLQRPTTM